MASARGSQATGSLSLAGALTLDAGIFQLNAGTTSVGSFSQSGGELAGTGTLTVSGTTALSGGLMEGGSASARQGNLVAQGPLTIMANSSNGIGTGLDGGWTLTADGTTTWTSGYLFRLAVWWRDWRHQHLHQCRRRHLQRPKHRQLQYRPRIRQQPRRLRQCRLFDKTASSGASTTTVSTAFNNTGKLEVDAGTVDLSGGGTDSGSFTGAGTLEFGGGTGNYWRNWVQEGFTFTAGATSASLRGRG